MLVLGCKARTDQYSTDNRDSRVVGAQAHSISTCLDLFQAVGSDGAKLIDLDSTGTEMRAGLALPDKNKRIQINGRIAAGVPSVPVCIKKLSKMVTLLARGLTLISYFLPVLLSITVKLPGPPPGAGLSSLLIALVAANSTSRTDAFILQSHVDTVRRPRNVTGQFEN